jgi:dipeptidyl aminopeptidase/acylaminoacyl peptidase
MRLRLFLLTFIIVIFTLSSQAQQPRGLQISDLASLKVVSDAQISPDGNHIVLIVSEVSPDHSRTISRLWLVVMTRQIVLFVRCKSFKAKDRNLKESTQPILSIQLVPTQGGEVQRLTKDEAHELSLRWSPDGKLIAFYSDQGKQAGLWVASPDGGNPRLAAHIYQTNFYLTHAGESFTWLPDGKWLTFLSSPEMLADVTPLTDKLSREGEVLDNSNLSNIPEQVRRPLIWEEIDQLLAEVREMILRLQGQAALNSPAKSNEIPLSAPQNSLILDNYLSRFLDGPRMIRQLQYKSHTSFSDTRQSHIFIAELATGHVQQVTFGNYYDHLINWSPRGEEIVFVSNRESEPDKINNTDPFIVNVSARQMCQLTDTTGCECMPIFSPDGQDSAFTATKLTVTQIDSVAEDTHVFFMPVTTGTGQGIESQELNKERDRHVFVIRCSPNDKFVLFIANDHGKTILYQAIRLGSVKQLFDYEAQISNFSVATEGPLAITISDSTHPPEIYVTLTLGKFEPVTKLNQTWLGTFQSVMPCPFTFDNENLTIQGWLYPPIGFGPGANKNYPVVLSIHGGPHSMFGYTFNTMARALAARGYSVLLINSRGSSGCGQKFSNSCIGDWGDDDYRDLMQDIDRTLEFFSFLDKERIGVSGGSYGGYMTNWVIIQTPRFRAAITIASLSNLISFYSTSLYQNLIYAEFNGYPYDNFELLWERLLLKHTRRGKTSILITHSELDKYVCITQAEEFYTALRIQGKERPLCAIYLKAMVSEGYTTVNIN